MTDEQCKGCIYKSPTKRRCYYDVEALSGEDLDEFTICRWNSRRIKNRRDCERKKEQRKNQQEQS